MTGKFSLVVLYISRKDISSQMMNLLLLMVDLRVMGAFDAPTKTLDTMKQKSCSILLGKR
jgi:hypothetical protein